jgi:hypothetical protein
MPATTLGASIGSRHVAILAAALVVLLAIVAWASPAPDRVTDRDIYEAAAARIIVPDCTDLHCFRVLVPWLLGRLPGSSDLRWKAYAVVCNAAAAIGVALLCPLFGLGGRASILAAVLSAFGFGSLYTLHDPFTSDPLMFALGPALLLMLLTDRVAVACAIATVGVLAKEFAAAPLYLVAGYHAIERRFVPALRAVVAGNLAFIVWVAFTLALMLRFNYGWGGTDSANLATGAGIGPWLQRQSARGVAAAMFNEFGALYVLAPVGLWLGPRELRRLALVAAPLAAVFAYVQQPDRALWNFHFLVVPPAALVLSRVPTALAWAIAVLFAIGNLRVGAQLPTSEISRVAIALSLVLALVSVALALRRPTASGPALTPNRALA